ncbi:hypothetical protein GUJ93_ZPchr0002g24881 [Zizania palustris]|uniref:Mei2-like C-terminal RNA recognition motif domain-containing protein n=1 Tax=Zizania palustris TaxID=103762 RepID=A0A8J5S320_ZIZPA|nr:hypothetical protein GUJ93_ZPchr0002g24881 [Zizania palustris]
MDSSLSRGLNPAAAPYAPVGAAHAPATAFVPTLGLYPPPPPPSLPWFAPVMPVEVPAFQHAGWVDLPPPPPYMIYVCQQAPPPPAPPTAGCQINEIVADRVGNDNDVGKVGAGGGPSPRSVLTPWKAAISPPNARRSFHPIPPPSTFVGITSLMIRNIPNKFRKEQLMSILDQHCAEENKNVGRRSSEYDFLYVPIDFGTCCNKGYAFVNMTTADAAWRLVSFLQNHRWDAVCSGKVCDVVPAKIQGRENLVAHFSSSRFPCSSTAFLPVWFEPPRDGERKTAAHVVGDLR